MLLWWFVGVFFFYPWVRFLLSSFLLDSVTLLQAPPGSQLAQQCPLQAVPQIGASLGFKPSGITQCRCCWLAPTGHPPNSGTPREQEDEHQADALPEDHTVRPLQSKQQLQPEVGSLGTRLSPTPHQQGCRDKDTQAPGRQTL